MVKNSLRIWKKRIVALHKDGMCYKKIAKTLKLSSSMVAKTIQWFNRTGSTQNKPRHGRPKKDMDYWNDVLWSDETKINLFGSDGVI